MKKPSRKEVAPPRTARPPRAPASGKEIAKESRPVAGPAQAQLYEQAVRLFHAGSYAEAKALFEQAGNGESREMAHSARLYVRMCVQRTARMAPALSTADDFYNYAVALINRRDFQAALKSLEQALSLAGDSDYLHYAVALCRGSLGDFDGAHHHLRRAIELHPRNRAAARNDPDFAELARQPRIHDLLTGGKG